MRNHHVLAVAMIGTLGIASEQSAIADSSDIETVVVTATKRPESIQDVAISMNTYSGAQIAQANIGDLAQLSTQIPGVTFFQSPTVPAFSMRGFLSPSSNPASDQTVAVYTDGIYEGRARQFQSPFFDVDHIEVLRGTQGALLGKNTSAGAISIVTADPKDVFESAFTGNYLIDRAGTDISGYVTGPLSDDLSGRAAIKYYKTTDGWLDNAATGQSDPRDDTIEGRLSLAWTPSNDAKIVTKVEYSDMTEDGRPVGNFPGTVPIDQVIGFNRDVGSILGWDEGLRLKSFLGSSTGTFGIGDLTLVTVTGLSSFGSNSRSGGGATDPEVFGIGLDENFSQASQEIRLLSPTGQRFEWIAGGYFDYSAYTASQLLRYNLFGGLFSGRAHSDFHQHGRTYSVFGTGTWHITDDIAGIVGLRWTRIGKSADYLMTQDQGLPFGFVPGQFIDGHFSEDHFDPSVTLQYRGIAHTMLYASWSRGSKGGAFQGASLTVTPDSFALKPESSQDFDVGAKTQISDWLTLDLAAYQLGFRNLQVGQYVGNPPTVVTVNAGRAQSRGFEWVTTLYPVDNLSIDLTGTYIDAKYLDYPGAACTYEQALHGCINGSVNAAGSPLSGVSKWSFTLSADYNAKVASDLRLTFQPEIDFRSRWNVDAGVENPYFGYQPGNAKLNLRVALGSADDRWSVAFVGRNLLDSLTVNGAFSWGPPFVAQPTAVATIDEGRSLALQFSMHFN